MAGPFDQAPGRPAAPGAGPAYGYGYGGAGAAGGPQAAYGAPASKPTPVLSLISLIAGIIGIIGSPIAIIPFVGGILQLFIPGAAVVLGFIGRGKEPAAKGMWLTGIILGFIGVGIALLSFVLWGVVFSFGDAYYSGY
ncbi:hypothetical protein [Agromyces marinus]|uniref:hypothetical protein n=1 Tax=Agromyces marinus TaxID=1389020 RepID=UPI001F4315AB|nr:hypothetical protein [Agromyces marinus]